MASTVSSSNVALAFAVAALQNVGRMGQTEGIPDSLYPTTGAATTSSNTVEHDYASESVKEEEQQCAGSGSDSNESSAPTASQSPKATISSYHYRPSSEGDKSGGDNSEEDAEKRLARSRERNREHARRTRLRKKAQLEALQSKVKGLEAERQVLKQNIEECSIASILLGLSSGEQDQATQSLLDSTATAVDATLDQNASRVAMLAGGKRKRFVTDMMQNNGGGGSDSEKSSSKPLKASSSDGQTTTTVLGGGKSHINWKTGVYMDDHGVQKKMTTEQLEDLRRERNRMHAKMTRDRKKCFIATIEKTIEDLESDCQRMRDVLSKVSAGSSFRPLVRPIVRSSPELVSKSCGKESANGGGGDDDCAERPAKRVPHGFSLIE